ncbi:MAG TPA: penicillin-binding protein 2 [Mycobacteriales bacterium]|nr:penicillin-binding protein 2 [Mycobacteriales bacterium]
MTPRTPDGRAPRATPARRPAAARSGTPRAAARTTTRTAARPGTSRPATTRARKAPPRRRPAARRGDPRRRLHHALLVIAAVLTVLAGRLVQLQGLESTAYAAKAEQQRLRKVELAAARGSILDRDGEPLAMNVDARAVYADPKLVLDPDASARKLAPLLRVAPADLAEKLRRRTRFVYLARGVDPEVARNVLALKVPGVGTLPETRRVYPNGGLGAAIVGFVGREGDGLGGIEYALEKDLAGKPGEELVEEDTQGRQIPAGEHRTTPPVAGVSQVLTIDRDIQWQAEHVLAEQVAKTHAKSGQIVVMDVRTGEIYALAVAPSFDPNKPTAAPPERRGNPALSTVYEPGSVNKVITAAAAIETGLMTPETPVTVPPSIRIADHTFTDAHAHGTEHLTFAGVLAESSNIGTIGVAQRLGKDRLYEYLRRFGLGERTGIRFPGESPGLLPQPEDWWGTAMGTIPIGQGVAATSIQVAAAYAAIANGGVRVQPSLVKGSLDANGHLVPAPAPKQTRAVSPRTASQVTRMLEAVVSKDGTAPMAAIDGYRVAGKTGTARKVRTDGRGYAGYVASFVGFAPADAPRLVVEVVLDDPVPIFGGLVSAPVFRTVMGFALGALRVPPTGRAAPPVRLRLP